MKSLPHAAAVLAAALTVAATGCGGGGDDLDLPPNAVARVGSQIVSEAALNRELRAAFASQGGTLESWGPPRYAGCMAQRGEVARPVARRECRALYERTRADAARTLLRAAWIDQEARRRDLDAGKQVSKLLRAQEQRILPATLRKLRASQGDPQVGLRMDLEQRKLLEAMPTTEAEIVSYARRNADVYHDPDRRLATILQADTKRDAKRGRADLRRGVPWEQVMREYGVRPFSEHWTMRDRWIRQSAAPHDAFGRGLFASPLNTVIGPVRTLNGWFVFTATRERRARKGLSAKAHDTVRFALRKNKLEEVLERRYEDETVCAQELKALGVAECIL